jgi:hypothetical protein
VLVLVLVLVLVPCLVQQTDPMGTGTKDLVVLVEYVEPVKEVCMVLVVASQQVLVLVFDPVLVVAQTEME